MNSSLTRIFGYMNGSTWWIIVLFFLFLAFHDCWDNICVTDWIPFLILLLIVCSCGLEGDDCNYTPCDNEYICN